MELSEPTMQSQQMLSFLGSNDTMFDEPDFSFTNSNSYSNCGRSHHSRININNNNNKRNQNDEFQHQQQQDTRRKEMKSTEALLSSAINELSMQERSKAMDDLHCVGDEIRETPEMIQKSLAEFDQGVHDGNFPIYNQAASQNRAYVEQPSFRLMFLRANSFDAKKSIQQMLNHVRQKAIYFGVEKIARDISIEDLSSEDIEVLLSGLLHVQGDKDRAGRSILCSFGHLMGHWNNPTCGWTIENVIRAHYYLMFNVLLPMPAVQTKGIVAIYYESVSKDARFIMPTPNDFVTMKAYRNTIPIRYSALHLCLKNEKQGLPLQNSFLETMLKSLPRYTKVRTRLHYGNDTENLKSLRTYGIPPDSFPVDEEGKIRSDILNVWFIKHYSKEGNNNRGEEEANNNMDDQSFELFSRDDHDFLMEETMQFGFADDMGTDERPIAFPLIEVPAPADSGTGTYSNDNNNNEQVVNRSAPAPPVDNNSNNNDNGNSNREPVQPAETDILLGRGVRLMQHPGNIRFREFLERYQDDYDRAQRNKRRKVSSEVVRALTGKGVRFLERNEDGDWVVADHAEAEDKVGQLFRSRRKLLNKKGSIGGC
ncbi:unnamed protein product [Cylindrotheca closterium]|uniref:DUF6824 domain-containing protein n=1 Tax=Cylindrotheca closterium TaxID=2856 RepID=A0AAD2GCZ4_9STRA|nr:unnamed protein product [Cylindrotheca closterium]